MTLPAAIDWGEWLNLAIRWFHLTAGIAWIGSSFYFIWLDHHLTPPREGAISSGATGELWSVHGGGFYHKQKYAVAPKAMPADLHWFMWEAYTTWLTGFALLVLVYWVGAESYMIDPAKADLSQGAAIGIGAAALVIGWVVYDGLCRSPLGRDNRVLGAAWFAALVLAGWLLDSVLASRGAYLHVGAMIGTAMAANVFMVIIPKQRKAVAALIRGEVPDPALGKAGKQRSLHNNYMTLPVLFIMISHHYPMTYGAGRPWLVLALLGLAGVAVRHVFNLRHRGAPLGGAIAVAGVLALASVTYVAAEPATLPAAPEAAEPLAATGPATWASVQPIFARHCTSCHAAQPTAEGFTEPPLGVILDNRAQARAAAARVKKVAVDSHVMPIGNPTGMTPAERAAIGRWIAAGAPE